MGIKIKNKHKENSNKKYENKIKTDTKINKENVYDGFKQGQPDLEIPFIYDFNTSNKTFLGVHEVLKSYGVENNKFFLILYDKELVGVDPHDPDLSLDLQSRVVREVKRNFWYYIREVVFLNTEGGKSKFMLHIGNLSAAFLKIQNLNYYWEQPRQTGKTLGEMSFESYYFGFGCINTEFGFYNYQDEFAKKNLQRMIGILTELPSYLKLYNLKKNVDKYGNISYKDKGKAGKKITIFENDSLGNNVMCKTTGQTKSAASRSGRGATQAKINIDEIAHCAYNWLVWGSASYAHTTAAKNAKRAGKPHGVSFTSTPPDMKTKEGEFLYDFVKRKSAKFEPFMFDFTTEELNAYLKKNAQKDFFYITYQYAEMGYTEEWARDQLRQCATFDDYKRDVLLQWIKDLSENPYPQVSLNKIESIVKKEKYESIVIENKYHFKIYSGFEKAQYKKIMIGIDVGSGMGGNYDSSTMVGIDPDTTEVVFTFKSNEADTDIFSTLIYDFVTTYINECVLVIERNSIGKAIVDNIKKTDISHFLYYSPFSDRHELQGATPDVVQSGTKYLYGIINRRKIRKRLFEILSVRIKKYKRLFKSEDLYNEITDLIEKNGKIKHKDGAHDDLLIGYLFGLYVLLRDDELYNNFDIKKPKPLTDNEEKEEYDLDNFNVNDQETIDITVKTTGSTNTDEKVPEIKTLEEHVKEMEEKEYRKRLRNNEGSTDDFDDMSDEMDDFFRY